MTSKNTQRIAEWLVLSSSLCLVNCQNGPATMATDGHDDGGVTPKGDAQVDGAAPGTGGAPSGSTGGAGGSGGHVSAGGGSGGGAVATGGGTGTGDGGGGAPAGDDDAGGPEPILREAGQGSTVALSADDSRLLVVNRDAGSVSVFDVSFGKDGLPSLAPMGEVSVCEEPWQAAMHPSGNRAYVVCRKDQLVVEVTGLHSKPSVGRKVSVGSEPTGLTLTPKGHSAWVANLVDGTLLEVDTARMVAARSVDLNATLAASGYLGSGLAGRPALAHPRSVAVSNNLDGVEEDETIYATEYYAQTKVPLAADGTNADVNKVGVLYKIPLRTLTPSIIEIPPMLDTGINDHNGKKTGCYPNQLLSLRLNGAFGYVVSLCASPRLPWTVYNKPFAACTSDADCPGGAAGSCTASKCITNCVADTDCGATGGKCQPNQTCAPNYQDVKTSVHSTVTVVDLGGNKTFSTVNLNKEFDTYYRTNGYPDTVAKRMPLTAYELGFIPETVTGFFPAMGADSVFRVDFDPNYQNATIISVGDPSTPFIDLSLPTQAGASGQMPNGIAVTHQTHATQGPYYAFVANEVSRNVSVLDLRANEVVGASQHKPLVVASSAPTTGEAAELGRGKLYWNTGLNRWSANGQAWIACASCHIDGLSDNVSWFGRFGARQSTSLDGTFASKDPTDVRQMNWNSSNDEVSDNESPYLRSILGGVGAIVKDPALNNASRIDFAAAHGGLNGSSLAASDPANPAGLAAPSVIPQWEETTKYLKTIRSPRRPTNLDPAKVAAGKALFSSANCQGCHGGPKWTISRVFYTPDPTGAVNTALKTRSWSQTVLDSGFPAALIPVATPANRTMRYAGTTSSADSLLCGLRPVGTYAVAEPEVGAVELLESGAAAPGAAPDANGYNPPSLLGLSLGAPYFHAGGARTLEAALGDLFATHRSALSPSFLDASDPERASKVANLVQYLLSIDEDADVVAIPALGAAGGDFCSAP